MWKTVFKGLALAFMACGVALGLAGCGDRETADAERDAYRRLTEHQQERMQDPAYRQMVEMEQERQ